MSSLTSIGYLASFARKDVNNAFPLVAEVVSITPPQLSKDTPDVTHMASPDGYREFISGLRDGGEVSLELNYVPADATQNLLREDINVSNSPSLILDFQNQAYLYGNNSPASEYRVIFPDNSMVQFEGYVNSMSPAVPLDDKMNLSVGLKVTGKPTWGYVSA